MQPDIDEVLARYARGELDEHMDAEDVPSLSVDEVMRQVMTDLDRPEPWVPTGFPKLDKWMDGGIRPGEVMLIAARPSVGKSAFALQVILHMLEQNVRVALWSLEMRPKQWIRRALSALTGIPLPLIRRSELSDDQIVKVSTAMAYLKGKPLVFVPDRNTTPKGFARAAEQEAERGAKVLVVDYLQLMQAARGKGSREQEVAETSRTMKQVSNELGVSTIALAQLKRDASGKVPQLSDLRESGALEQDADEVVFLHREPDRETNLLTERGLLILGKNRDGRVGGAPVHYDWRTFSFQEVK